ncbi:MAG: dTDP-4-dehydrorhamnose reductase [Muribaculaceae bacterium]|nr:dTDP-4-dehydrorhamnose reductase [Muribaculaceae bacterium]
MNILITGANGQLGREMRNVMQGHFTLNGIYTDVEELDITSLEAINAFLDSHPADVIVNCAAYTAVDRAEQEADLCHKLNVEAIENLAMAAKAHHAKLIHISTDYVFDGTAHRPYSENHPTCPASVYGNTKLDGEKRLQAVLPNDSIILRTAWLYSPYGKNFVKTMLELGRTRSNLNVVYDQVGTPTYALDLAQTIVKIILADEWKPGIYHYSNEGVTSWYDFTKAIHAIAGIITCNVMPCHTNEYPTAAQRPHYSVLDKTKIKTTFGCAVPYWRDSLVKCIDILKQQ